jgi:hypothetical protein
VIPNIDYQTLFAYFSPVIHRFLTLLLLTSVFFSAPAQVVVSPITLNQGKDWLTYRFPFIQSKQPLVAQKINQFLQKDLLDNPSIITDSNKIFAVSRYISEDSNGQSGYSAIDYTVSVNNTRLLSIQFDLESTGAYSTNYPAYYNFDNRTGEVITGKTIFTPAGLQILKARLLKERNKQVAQHIKDLKGEMEMEEDSVYIPETFKECLKYAEGDAQKIFIKARSIVFYKEFCFPHMLQPYEADLDVEIPIQELTPYLSAYGKKLLGH